MSSEIKFRNVKFFIHTRIHRAESKCTQYIEISKNKNSAQKFLEQIRWIYFSSAYRSTNAVNMRRNGKSWMLQFTCGFLTVLFAIRPLQPNPTHSYRASEDVPTFLPVSASVSFRWRWTNSIYLLAVLQHSFNICIYNLLRKRPLDEWVELFALLVVDSLQ